MEILTDTVRLTQGLIDSIVSIPEEDRSEANRRELAGLMLNRGQMLGEIGRTMEEGEAHFNYALKALEDMIWEFGEESVDRKSVVQGKSVDLGGRRILKKKNI